MSAGSFAGLLDPVRVVARAAADSILAVYQDDFAIRHKDDASPLTQADLAAHARIVEGLRTFSDWPILSEESPIPPYAERQAWTHYWLVDPLDGTKEFIKRNGEFTVNIALIADCRPVLGVVLAPATGVCYYAAVGCGAFRATFEGAVQPLRVRVPCPSPPTVVISASHRTPALDDYLQRLPAYQLLAIGSSLKFCRIAEGVADVYPRLGPTCEWDTAAAQCVVEQAGGRVVDLAGRALRYNTRDNLLNPYFFVIADDRQPWLDYYCVMNP